MAAWRTHLQRHVPVELRIPCSIHLPHAAFADLGGDQVRAECGAGLERHGWRAYAAPTLHPKHEVVDVHVQEVRHPQPGDPVRIHGRPWLAGHFRAVDQEANLTAANLHGQGVR